MASRPTLLSQYLVSALPLLARRFDDRNLRLVLPPHLADANETEVIAARIATPLDKQGVAVYSG